MESNVESITLRDYLKVLFRHKILFVIIPIIIIIPVYIWLQLPTPLYGSSVKLNVKAMKETESLFYKVLMSGPASVLQEHTELVKSRIVFSRVVEALKLYETPPDYEMKFASPFKAALMKDGIEKMMQRLQEMTPEQKKNLLFEMAIGRLSANVKANVIRDTSFFNITVTDFNPQRAAVIANSLSRSYLIFDIEQQIAELELKYGKKHSTVLQLENYIEEIKKTLDGRVIPDLEAIGPASVKIAEQATIGEAVNILPKQFLLILAFFSSMVVTVIFAYLFEYFDYTFKSPIDVERFLNISVLGFIPKRKSKVRLLISEANPTDTNYIKSYKNLSEQIYLFVKNKSLKSFLITDAEGSEQTATIVANLGIYLAARQGHKVLIIDANLGIPSMSKIFNTSNTPGLSDVLGGKISFEETVHKLDSNLYILPAGNTVLNPITFLESSNMSEVIKKAKEQFEVVFIECADLRNFTDAVILSSIVDGVILVVTEGKVRRHIVKNAIAPLEEKKVNLVGVILNNRKFPIPEIIYKWM